ncbi:MAG: DUF3100 domain-containing protein [Methanosphaera sp.]
MDKKDKTDSIDMFDYKLHLTILIIVVISEYIGIFHIHLIKGVSLVILPIIYALVLAMLLYQLKPFKWIDEKQSRTSSKLLLLLIGPLIAKLAIISGQNITLLINTGPLILLEEVGDLGSIFVALPVALLLGFKREAIGMTSSICREPQMAVIIDKYGFNSPEVNGFMIVYLIGAVLGTIFISIIASVLSTLIPLHPYAYALACGVGSTSMNVAAVSSLATIYPAISQQLYAYSGISNLISVILSIYVYILISLPLTEKLYYKLEPIISKYIIRR